MRTIVECRDVCKTYLQGKIEVPALKNTWLLVTLSFLFYIPVAVAASLVPMLGMLMLPKTVCYILLIVSFCRYAKGAETA